MSYALDFCGGTATEVAENPKAGELPPLYGFDKIVFLMGTNEVLQDLAEVPTISCKADLDDLNQRVNKRIKDFSQQCLDTHVFYK